MTRKIQWFLVFCAVANIVVVLYDLAAGGIWFRILGIKFSSWEIHKPVRYAAACLAVAIWLRDRDQTATTWDLLPRWSGRAALLLAIGSAVLAAWFGIHAAGGADAFGYVSEAQLWADGRLVAPDPLAPVAPELGLATVPLGYTRAGFPGAIVPTYSPGLPILMAFAQRLGGGHAVYAVVPLLAALAVWMTYVIGRRTDEARTGIVAAALLAFSPLFLLETMEPMCDVPATAWWMTAWAAALAPGSSSAFVAGTAAAMAILTRPNLAPLAIVALAAIALQPPRARRAALFLGSAAAGCALVAAFNWSLYGSPTLSGYGPLGVLFVRDHLWPNLQRYPRWMLALHTPVLLLALVAAVSKRTWIVRLTLVFCAGVAASYAFYLVYDDWPFARFLLPSLPLLVVLVGIVLVQGVARLPAAWRGAALFAVCVVLVSEYVTTATRLGVFAIHDAERRYATVGEYLGRTLPPNAVVLSVIESGSVRWHGGRMTLKWDYLPPGQLDRAIRVLHTRGYAAYILVEDFEEPFFRRYFANGGPYGALDWPPVFEYEGAGHDRLYRVADRERFLRGEPIPTFSIPAP